MKELKTVIFSFFAYFACFVIWYAFFEIFKILRVNSRFADAIIAIGIAYIFVIIGMLIWAFIVPENIKIIVHKNSDKLVPWLAIMIPFVTLYYLTDKLFTTFRFKK